MFSENISQFVTVDNMIKNGLYRHVHDFAVDYDSDSENKLLLIFKNSYITACDLSNPLKLKNLIFCNKSDMQELSFWKVFPERTISGKNLIDLSLHI